MTLFAVNTGDLLAFMFKETWHEFMADQHRKLETRMDEIRASKRRVTAKEVVEAGESIIPKGWRYDVFTESWFPPLAPEAE